MLLKLNKVARFYGPRLIFKDVTLEVFPSSVTLLAGANGAGKSTLLKIMAGLIPPSSGEVLTGDQYPLVGYLGHQTFIYPELSALENLAFWASLYGKRVVAKELREILERVELAPYGEEKAKGFSRGMAQRLNLARVFLLDPELLLLDEPGTGLDTRSTGILHREIGEAKAKGAGIVWISHSLDQDLPKADHVAFLKDKRLAHYGPAASYHADTMHLQLSPDSSHMAPDANSPLLPEPAGSRRASGGEPC